MTTPSVRICSSCGRAWRPWNTKTRKGKCDRCGETPKNWIHNGGDYVPWRAPHRDDDSEFRRQQAAEGRARVEAELAKQEKNS